MTMPIAPGTYRIRNLGTGQYIAPVGGYSSPGRTIALEPYSQEATHKWVVRFLGNGAYVVENFAANFQLQPGIPANRRTLPVLEVNIPGSFTWKFGETPNGQGVFMVQWSEQDQVAEADPTAGNAVLNDLDRSRTNQNQMWVFEVAP